MRLKISQIEEDAKNIPEDESLSTIHCVVRPPLTTIIALQLECAARPGGASFRSIIQTQTKRQENLILRYVKSTFKQTNILALCYACHIQNPFKRYVSTTLSQVALIN